MKKYFVISAAVVASAVAVALSAGYASASTADVLTVGAVGGANVSVGDAITAALQPGGSATFYTTTTGTAGQTCSSASEDASVQSNPAAGGVADLSITQLAFGGCTSTMYDSMSLTITSGPTAANASVFGVGIPTIAGKLTGVNGLKTSHCYYTGTNLAGLGSFTNQELDLNVIGSTGNCAAKLFFSANFGIYKDSSVTGSPQVFVNH